MDSITAAGYNIAFTSLPILLFATLDRPVKDLKAFLRYPRLYDKRRSRSLTTASFWKAGIGLAIVHGAVCFFVPYYRCAVLPGTVWTSSCRGAGGWGSTSATASNGVALCCWSGAIHARTSVDGQQRVCTARAATRTPASSRRGRPAACSLATSGEHNITDVYSLGKVYGGNPLGQIVLLCQLDGQWITDRLAMLPCTCAPHTHRSISLTLRRTDNTQVCFISLLGTVTLEVALISRYWTWLFGLLVVISYAIVYPFLYVFQAIGERS